MKPISVLMLLVTAAFSQNRTRLVDYALVLEDPPIAQKVQSRAALKSSEAQAQLATLRGAQRSVIAELGRRKVQVSSTSQLLVNAVFVRVSADDAAALKNIPGVKWMQYLPPVKPMLNTALDLVGVPAAWAAIGGSGSAGAGIKIGIIDTGIDQNHPGFQDSSLKPPAGFPAGDAAFTNNKVIVARSYVSMLNTSDPPSSTPDDFSARDRQGHGTAIAMIAAGVQHSAPLGTISGVAPKAFLGNYKVFGSPGVNEYTLFPAWNQALTDAINDGMDIVTLSLGEGDPAIVGPLDTGVAVCGDPICDVRSQAVESATKLGLLVVAAAGNGGDIGTKVPTQNSLNTPGVAPSALTVGASTNRHLLYQRVRVNGSSLGDLRALFGDGPKISSPVNTQVTDVATLGNDGQACTALSAGSLTGVYALIQRGTCAFSDKINFAQAAGATGVILYNSDGNQDITQRLFVQNTGIPAALIGNNDGVALKTYLAANPKGTLTLDPAMQAADNPQVNTVAPFSSRGPSIGNFASTRDFALKPEVVAPGVDVYTATQKFDPNADTYNATGYTRVSGTSYAVPFAAGVAAMVKAKNPKWTPGQLKSAVVNTATMTDLQGTVHVTDAGAGKINAAGAVSVAATLEPAAISFGAPTSLPVSRSLTLTNVSNANVNFTLAVRPIFESTTANVTLSDTVVPLQPGASKLITASLSGSRPGLGSYEGFIDVTGAGPTLHLPYLYIGSSGVPFNIFPIINGSFTGVTNDTEWLVAMRVIDPFGVPVANLPVSFRIQAGGGKFSAKGGDKATDVLGNAGVYVDLGPQQSDQIFIGTAGNYTQEFDGFARRPAVIKSGGVVNAATFQAGAGMAPGSYISIFGSDLSDTNLAETTPSLPVSLGQVSVSFDGGGKSLPGHLHFISPGQVNVQIPWEYQGQSSVAMKVTLYGYQSSTPYTVPLTTYSPGIFAVTNAAGAAITAANPAKGGDVIVIYANGLGPVDTPQTSGDPASTTKLVGTLAGPTVTIGGTGATVQFSGLAPGFVGLYQVNVQVPAGVPTGTQTLKLSIGGADVSVNLNVQ